MTRPNLNAVAKVPTEFDGAICSTGFEVLRPIEVEPDWLFLVVKSRPFIEEMTSLVQGALYPAVRPADVRAYRFTLPPLAEQRRIVAKIEALQERSRRAREALVEVGPLLEQFRQSVLAAAFRGDLTADWRAAHPNIEPASELLHRISAERRRHWEENELARYRGKGKGPTDDQWKQQYPESLPLEYPDLPEIPPSWEWVNWSALTIWVTYGFTRPMPHVDTGRMIITAKNVKNTGLDLTETHFTTEEAFQQLSPKDRPLPGDILIIKDGATTGRATLVPEDMSAFCINQSVAVVWLKHSSMNRQFLLRWIQAPFIQRQIQLAMAGNAMPHLSITDFAQMPVPIPPLEEQQEICERVEGCLRSILLFEETSRTIISSLELLDQSILAKAFRGELVPQEPSDEPASVLLERVRSQQRQQVEAIKKASKVQRRNKMRKKWSGLWSQHRLLVEVLTTKGKPISPEQLLTEAGYGDDSIEDFYSALREEIAQGHIREHRLTESDVMLEAVKQ